MQVTTQEVEAAVTANNLYVWRNFTIEEAENAVPAQPFADALRGKKEKESAYWDYYDSEESRATGN